MKKLDISGLAITAVFLISVFFICEGYSSGKEAAAYQRGVEAGKQISKEEKANIAMMWWSGTSDLDAARKRMCMNVSDKAFKKEKK